MRKTSGPRGEHCYTFYYTTTQSCRRMFPRGTIGTHVGKLSCIFTSPLLDSFHQRHRYWRLELSMIFCHGCAKQVHETAHSCPNCGATQARVTNQEAIHWASIASFITSIIAFVMILAEPDGKWDKDTVLGGIFFGIIPIAFGVYSFSQTSKKGRWMGITGLCLGVIVVLVSAGSM